MVDRSLVEAGYSFEQLEGKGQRTSGFVLRCLIGDDGDYTRGSLVVYSKQPGDNHPVVASEQHITEFDGVLQSMGSPQPIPLEHATEVAPIPYDLDGARLAGFMVAAEMLRRNIES